MNEIKPKNCTSKMDGSDDVSSLTKRELIATMVLQGLLASGRYDNHERDISNVIKYAQDAVNQTDALIQALNK